MGPKGAPVLSGLGWMALVLGAAAIALDQAVKAWLLGPFDLPGRGAVDILPVFRLTYVQNGGVAFGLLQAHAELGRWMLVGFAACVVVALLLWLRRIDRILSAAAIGLIIGGAISNNIIDRVRWGAVFDYLDFSGLLFPWVFNIADASISIGVGLLLLDSVLPSAKQAGS
ncbi:MAG TPA: signal peptidase II [Caulobacteraceae bacterium]|nr:signal peptidase II [Caulobacteraceae bacterium]